MASLAGATMGAASVHAADGNYTTSKEDAKGRKWSVVVGGGGYAPDYEGSDDYEIQPFPFVSIVYDDVIFINGTSLGVNLLSFDGLKAGPITRYSFGRNEDDNHALDGLGNVEDSIEVGGFANYGIGIWSAELTVVQDVGGGHEGLLAEATTGVSVPLTETLKSSLEASANWASSDYMDTYFGISPKQSAKSGLSQFDAMRASRMSPPRSASTTCHREHRALERAQYKRLLNDAADSPIVYDRGSADQFFGGLFLTYTFR